jgi:plastocyanin
MRKFILTTLIAGGVSLLAGSAFAAEHAVAIKGFKFSPANLTVAVGDTIVFTNEDGAPHTATSEAFDTGTIAKGASASVTIAAAGETDYHCNFHPMMKGKITAN